LLATLSAAGEFEFHLHRDWRSIVESQDQEYIEALCHDFKERAGLDAIALFTQLSSLAVGPLVTVETGSNLSDYPSMMNLLNRFMVI
jgi:hypothetical protein